MAGMFGVGLALNSLSVSLLQVKYKKDFEESKGRGFSIVSDTPEMQRLRKTQEQISNVCSRAAVCPASVCLCVGVLWSVSTVDFCCTIVHKMPTSPSVL